MFVRRSKPTIQRRAERKAKNAANRNRKKELKLIFLHFALMNYQLSVVVLWSLTFCCVGAANDSEIVEAEENVQNCSFYCFLTPQKKTRINESDYDNIVCTHFVYGFANVRRDNTLSHPSIFDLPTYTEQGNYRNFARMNRYKGVKSLLGIRQARQLSFIDNEYTSSRFAEMLIDTARLYHFDGLFLDFDGNHYRNFHFHSFLRTLTRKADEDASTRLGVERLFLVLAVPASRVRNASSELEDIQEHFDALYMVSDAILSAEDPFVASYVQPLHPSASVPATDSLSANAEKIVSSGVDPKKTVIGLSIWARSYVVEDPANVGHGTPTEGFGACGDATNRLDGRLSYPEICKKLRDKSKITYDSKSLALSLTDNDGQWYSFEMPKHESFKKKIDWISKNAFGGIGISSVDADDAKGICGEGRYPLHTFARKLAKCNTRNRRSSKASCSRVCVFQPDKAETSLNLEALPAGACTHFVISSATMKSGSVSLSAPAKEMLSNLQDLEAQEIPSLLLSFGAEETSATWRLETLNNTGREKLAVSVKDLVKEEGADGVVVAWTLEPLQSLADKAMLASFLTQLRKTLRNSTSIFLAIHHKSSFFGFYDVATINRTVDYVIVEAYRFHSPSSKTTGHHSAMFSHSDILADSKLSVEALVNDLHSRGVPRSKILIGLSAAGIKRITASDESSDFKGNLVRLGVKSFDGTSISQTEVCEMAKSESATKTFLRQIGVPFLIDGDTFVAYDDEESSRIKTLWASLNDFGGLAIYDLEADNPQGTCPKDVAFPILRSVTEAHICKSCPPLSKSKCRPAMRVVCPYRLPDDNDIEPLRPYELPFKNCTEIVVEEAILDENMELNYRDGRATSNMQLLMTLLTKLEDQRLTSSVRCEMTKEQFARILDQRTTFISRLMQHVKAFGFTGVELKCDNMLGPENKQKFTNLLNDLTTQMNALNSADKCPRTVSIRIPAWRKDLRKVYDITVLNSLHHVVLEPFRVQIRPNTTPLTSPLFPLANKTEGLSIASTVKAWVAAGLKPNSILLQIPTYGTLRKLASPEKNSLGDLIEPKVKQILRQKQMCLKNRDNGYRERIDYGTVAVYGTTPDGFWISYETQQTIVAKVRYAMREGLAGVAMMTVNEDDNNNSCSQGLFPLLSTVTRVLDACGLEKTKQKKVSKS